MAAEDGKSQDPAPGSGSPPSMEDLARRLMDLWQEQMAAIAADPDLMRQMARMMAASPFPAMMQGIMQGMLNPKAPPPGGNPYEWWKGQDGARPTPPAPARSAETGSAETGAATAAPASQPGGGDLAELRRNLAGLEARLAELGAAGHEIADAAEKPHPGKLQPAKPPAKPKPAKRAARKPAKPVAGPDGGGGEGGAGGAGGGAAG